jgi:hypothetical protein
MMTTDIDTSVCQVCGKPDCRHDREAPLVRTGQGSYTKDYKPSEAGPTTTAVIVVALFALWLWSAVTWPAWGYISGGAAVGWGVCSMVSAAGDKRNEKARHERRGPA